MDGVAGAEAPTLNLEGPSASMRDRAVLAAAAVVDPVPPSVIPSADPSVKVLLTVRPLENVHADVMVSAASVRRMLFATLLNSVFKAAAVRTSPATHTLTLGMPGIS